MAKILFYIVQDYYWESLEPVYAAYVTEGRHDLYIKIGKNQRRVGGIFLISDRRRLEANYRRSGYRVTSASSGFDVVYLGAQVAHPERFGDAILVNLDHGPGIKTLRYRHLLKQRNVCYHCFVEGRYRLEKFKKYGLDKIHKIYVTGLPKLDCFFDGSFEKQVLIRKYGLNPDKKTVLYAPSFKPTSIFMVGEQIAGLARDYNVIVKLHPYSWQGKYAYHSHHRFFERQVRSNPEIRLVKPEQHDIRPYVFIADTMISDGSSVINEFLALERVGIIVDLPDEQQTHHDGTPLLENRSSEWLKESFVHFKEGDNLKKTVQAALNPDPVRIAALRRDKACLFEYTDGNSAERVKQVVDALLDANSA